jgi:hypothetical protein
LTGEATDGTDAPADDTTTDGEVIVTSADHEALNPDGATDGAMDGETSIAVEPGGPNIFFPLNPGDELPDPIDGEVAVVTDEPTGTFEEFTLPPDAESFGVFEIPLGYVGEPEPVPAPVPIESVSTQDIDATVNELPTDTGNDATEVIQVTDAPATDVAELPEDAVTFGTVTTSVVESDVPAIEATPVATPAPRAPAPVVASATTGSVFSNFSIAAKDDKLSAIGLE